MLWGDRDAEQARASLRQALAEVRRIMGEAVHFDRPGNTGILDPMAVSVDAVGVQCNWRRRERLRRRRRSIAANCLKA